MKQRKMVQSKALGLLGNRISMSKPAFVEEKLKQLEQRGIKIDWLKPKSQVLEQLTEELPKIGVNKWLADQAAKEIYGRIEIGVGEKETVKVGVVGRGRGRLTKGQQKRYEERVLNPVNRERKERQMFLKSKNRLEPKVARELEYSIKSVNMKEEDVVRLVKLTWAFKAWVKEHGLNGAEAMALEIARGLKRKEIARREWLERIQTFGHRDR